MGPPGVVVHPDGSKKFVEDKQAYFAQHPETIEPTRAAVEQHALQREDTDRYNDYQEAAETDRRQQEDEEIKEMGHSCVKGRVPKACDACRGSFDVPDGLESTGPPCKKCDATKTLGGLQGV